MPLGVGIRIGFRDGRIQFRLDSPYFRRQRGPDSLPPRRARALGVLPQQVPIDVPTPRRVPTSQPFPTGAAANDPVFSIWRKRLAKLLGRGNVAIASAEFIAIVLDALGQQSLDKVYSEEMVESTNAARRQRIETERENPTIYAGQPAPRPEPPDFPRIPRPDAYPGIPRQPIPSIDPGVIIAPFPSQVPGTSPGTIPQPGQLPQQLPDTGPGFWPGSPLLNPAPSSPWNPLTMPGRVRAPSRRARPQTNPSSKPRWRTGDPLPLTGVQPSVIQGQITGLNFQPETAAQTQRRKCPARRRKRRKLRNRCYKGLYREGRWDDQIDLTRWIEIDCETGRETTKPKLRLV